MTNRNEHYDVTKLADARRERDRVAAAARREAARVAGEPMGHGLDGLLIDGLVLMLAGRDSDDPVRKAFQHGLARAFRARGVKPSDVMSRRVGARLSLTWGLREALSGRSIDE